MNSLDVFCNNCKAGFTKIDHKEEGQELFLCVNCGASVTLQVNANKEGLPRSSAGARCTCKKWPVYTGSYDSDGYTLRCHGCLRSVPKCRC